MSKRARFKNTYFGGIKANNFAFQLNSEGEFSAEASIGFGDIFRFVLPIQAKDLGIFEDFGRVSLRVGMKLKEGDTDLKLRNVKTRKRETIKKDDQILLIKTNEEYAVYRIPYPEEGEIKIMACGVQSFEMLFTSKRISIDVQNFENLHILLPLSDLTPVNTLEIKGVGYYFGEVKLNEQEKLVPNGKGFIQFNKQFQRKGFRRLRARFTFGEIVNSTDIDWFEYCEDQFFFGKYRLKTFFESRINQNSDQKFSFTIWVPHGYGKIRSSTKTPFFWGKFKDGYPYFAHKLRIEKSSNSFVYKGGVGFETNKSQNNMTKIYPHGDGVMQSASTKELYDKFELHGSFNKGIPVNQKSYWINQGEFYEGEFGKNCFPKGKGKWWSPLRYKKSRNKLYLQYETYSRSPEILVVRKSGYRKKLRHQRDQVTKRLLNLDLSLSLKIAGREFSVIKNIPSYKLEVFQNELSPGFSLFKASSISYHLRRVRWQIHLASCFDIKQDNGRWYTSSAKIKSPFHDTQFKFNSQTPLASNGLLEKLSGNLEICLRSKKYYYKLVYDGLFQEGIPISNQCKLNIMQRKELSDSWWNIGSFFGKFFSGNIEPELGKLNYSPDTISLPDDYQIEFEGVFKDFMPSQGSFMIFLDKISNEFPIVRYSGNLQNYLPHGRGIVTVYGKSRDSNKPVEQYGHYQGQFSKGKIVPQKVNTPQIEDFIERPESHEYFFLNGIGKYIGEYNGGDWFGGYYPNGRGILIYDNNVDPDYRGFIGQFEYGFPRTGEYIV